MLSLEEIKELVKVLEESSLTKLKLKSSKYTLELEKKTEVVQLSSPVVSMETKEAGISGAKYLSSTTEITTALTDSATGAEEYAEITAPMVGTFYLAPEEGEDPFVEVGSKIEDESTVCILEAMKLFTEIEAECTGEIVEILVANGDFVEYGQPLFKVKVG